MHEVRPATNDEKTFCPFFVKTNETATQCSFLCAVLTIASGLRLSYSFCINQFLVFAREAFGGVKTTNFVSKNSAWIENFMS